MDNQNTNQNNLQIVVEKQELTPEKSIDEKAKELSVALAKAESKDDVEALYNDFKLTTIKKDAFRINKYNKLLDKVLDEAEQRFTKRPGELSNKEVLDYMTATQNLIDRDQKSVDEVKEMNAVQVNNTQNNTLNIHVGDNEVTSLNKASRDRITSVVAELMKELQIPDKTKDAEVIDNK